MSHVTTHVLDAALGRPAAGVAVTLYDAEGARIAEGVTDADGRVKKLGPESLDPGDYCLEFDVATPFFPRVIVEFSIHDGSHYHVPLLLSPYGYSTYRGS